jgi:hypothetical protein
LITNPATPVLNFLPYPTMNPPGFFDKPILRPLACKLRQDSTLVVDNNLHITFHPISQEENIKFAVGGPFVHDTMYRIRARVPDAQTPESPTPVSQSSPGASSSAQHQNHIPKPSKSPTPVTEPGLFIQMKSESSIRRDLSKMLTSTSE